MLRDDAADTDAAPVASGKLVLVDTIPVKDPMYHSAACSLCM